MRKKLLFLLLLLSSSLLLDAQIMVKSFIALESDMTASSLEGRRVDQNGEKAALIKVVTTETGSSLKGVPWVLLTRNKNRARYGYGCLVDSGRSR